MTRISSEADLTALERSKEQPILLIEHAALIAGASFDEQTRSYGSQRLARPEAATDFRQQWLLKWLLKKFNEGLSTTGRGQGNVSDGGFILRQKPWAFLAYLIHHISNQSVLDILLERNFNRTFCECAQIVLEHATSSDSKDNVATDFHNAIDTGERPQKRRRLSDEKEGRTSNGAVQSTEVDLKADLLVSLLEVASEFATILQHASSSSGTATRKIIPSWASSTKEAATLISRVVKIVNVLSPNCQTIQALESSYQSVTSCLSLWQDYSSTDSALDKQLVHTQFNENCLANCLDLLQSTRSQQHLATARAVQLQVEHQIALQTLLPVRAAFNDSCSSSWKAEQNVISWKNIEQPYTQFTTHLGGALEAEVIAGDTFISLKKIDYASSLLDIASRLVPKDDIRRRQWERPWFEALTLMLYHLAFPKDIFRLEKDQQGNLEPTGTILPPSPQELTLWPTKFLDTIQRQHLNLSTPALIYLVTATLLWRGQSPPVSIISQLVELDVNCFVPQTDTPVYQTCLDRLTAILEELVDLRMQDLVQVTQRVIVPLMKGFSRSRDLKSFVKLWLPHLEDALRARTTFDNVSDHVDCSLMWDDENLFSTFESICVLDAPQGLVRDLLTEVTDKVQSITRVIGSTADVLAKVAVLISVLRSQTSEFASASDTIEKLADLVKATCNALAQNNDYQGQRWRLWSLLRTLQSFDSFNVSGRDFYDPLWTPINDVFAKISSSSTDSTKGELLFEAYQCFLLLTECGMKDIELRKEVCVIVTKQLSGRLEQSLQIYASDDDFHRESWDGRIDSISNASQLLCGYLAALLRKPRFAQMAVTDELSHLLQNMALQSTIDLKPESSRVGSIGQLAQALLLALDDVAGKSAFQEFSEALLESKQQITPLILHSLPLDGVDRACISSLAENKYQEVLALFTMAERERFQDASAPLALLAKLVVQFPVSIGLPDQFLKLSKLVEATGTDDQGDSRELVRSSLIRIVGCFQDRALNLDQAEKRKKLKAQMKDFLDSVPVLQSATKGQSTDVKTILYNVVRCLLDEKRYEISSALSSHMSIFSEDASTDRLAELRTNGQSVTTEMVDRVISVNIRSIQDQNHKPNVGMLQTLQVPGDQGLDITSFLRIAALIKGFSKEDIQSSSEAVQTLNAMATLESSVDTTSILQLILKLETSLLILNSHPSIVNQASVDALLQSLSSIASSASKISKSKFNNTNEAESDQIQPSAIYDRLLDLLSILLTRHRRRLSGRTHLLLPLLQNLLKCLFYTPSRTYIHQNPSTTKQKQAFRSSLPSWLQAGSNLPLPASSAEKFSRILSSICNPSTASARSAHRSRRPTTSSLDLNDETRKAKRIAAQYMQYLIMEYARCTLDGVIAPETRDKLMPGLYVVLDALDRDLMRAMNAAMDPSSRAIFKGLYDDWVRFGKWDQN